MIDVFKSHPGGRVPMNLGLDTRVPLNHGGDMPVLGLGVMESSGRKCVEAVKYALRINDMPGCLSYILAKDPTDANAIWITEVWDSQASHQASLSLPSLQQSIAQGRPLIAGFGERFVTEPIGGYGLGTINTVR